MARRKVPERIEAVKQKILNAAIEIIMVNGFSQFTLTDVAEHLGLTKAALYWYYPSKDLLMIAIARAMRQAYVQHARTVADSVLSPYEKLNQILLNMDNGNNPYLCILPIKLVLEYFGKESRIRDYTLKGYEEYIQILTTILEEGMAQGQFRTDNPPKDVARWLVGAMDGLIIQNMMWPDDNMDKRFLKTIIETIIINPPQDQDFCEKEN